MNCTNSIRRRLRTRTGKRGAAMVEGIVIMSGMLCFLGLIVWTRQAWGMKLDLQQKTRSDSLYYASHACKSTGGGLGQPGGGGTAPGASQSAGSVANQGGGGDAASAMSGKWGKASAKTDGTAAWQAAFNVGAPNGSIQYARLPLISKVTAASQVLCNEPKYSSQLTAWLQFAIDLVKNGGGIGSLFSGG